MRAALVVAFVLTLVLVLALNGPSRFDTQRWIAARPNVGRASINERAAMFQDLPARHGLLGLTYAEVCALLGPDDGGNCGGFDAAKAGVKVAAGVTPLGPQVNPLPGPPCGRPHGPVGRSSMFGGLAPHLMYKIQESWIPTHQDVLHPHLLSRWHSG
jgi:hypothetical protein